VKPFVPLMMVLSNQGSSIWIQTRYLRPFSTARPLHQQNSFVSKMPRASIGSSGTGVPTSGLGGAEPLTVGATQMFPVATRAVKTLVDPISRAA